MRWLKTLPLHPILLAAYPVLALFAANHNIVLFAEVWRALLAAMACSAAGLLLLRLARLTWQRAALIVSVSVILFFSYGHVIFGLARASLDGKPPVRPELITLLWPAAWILLIWAAARLRGSPEPLTVFLNAASLILIGLVIGQVLARPAPALQHGTSRLPEPHEASAASPAGLGAAHPAPDIYYIILDGYGRADLLREVMGYDNRDFLRSLEEQGFTVTAGSAANYSNTAPSLASSLNFSYINDLAGQMPPGSMDYRTLRRLIRENAASAFLKQRGYTIVTMETGFNFTEIYDSDAYISLEGGPNYFESLLLGNSLALLWTNGWMAERYRERISGAFTRLADLSELPSPKFVFAHIMAAHPPFVFGPNGEPSQPGSSVELDRGDAGTRQREIEGYRGQLAYVNRRVLEMVAGIRRSSPVEPVIILQGDHGSGVYMDWQSAERTCFAERMAIFNAYSLPGAPADALYEDISPVNTFRVVFNTTFGSQFALLEDRSYFSLWESPYDLIEVTGQAGACPFRD